MPQPPLSDEDCLYAVELYSQYKSVQAAALATGHDWHWIKRRLNGAALRGLVDPVSASGVKIMPGFETTRVAVGPRGTTVEQKPERGEVFAVPDGHKISGVSAFVDAQGREIGKWVKTKEGDISPDALAKIIRSEFEGYIPATPALITERGLPERMAMYIIADAHLGLLTHAEEVGEDNSLEIGVDRLRRCMRDLVAETGSCEKALVINLGDAFHANDHKNMTPTSGHILDVAARFKPTARAAVSVFRECVDMALTKHDNVIVKHLPGNHDLTASIILETAAMTHYALNPRVTVDDDMKDYFFLRYGRNLTGWHHGHRLNKPEEMVMCMANECREDWGETDYHYFGTAHLHHSWLKEVGGCIVECYRTLAPADQFHSGKYGSGRSLSSITLDKEGGEHSRRHINLKPLKQRALVA